MTFKVVSNGTPDGTKVFENGEERTDILSVERQSGYLFVMVRVKDDDVEFELPEGSEDWGGLEGEDFFFQTNHPV